MEMVREYLIVSFLDRQEKEIAKVGHQGMLGYFGRRTGITEYSPEKVREAVYKNFGKG